MGAMLPMFSLGHFSKETRPFLNLHLEKHRLIRWNWIHWFFLFWILEADLIWTLLLSFARTRRTKSYWKEEHTGNAARVSVRTNKQAIVFGGNFLVSHGVRMEHELLKMYERLEGTSAGICAGSCASKVLTEGAQRTRYDYLTTEHCLRRICSIESSYLRFR